MMYDQPPVNRPKNGIYYYGEFILVCICAFVPSIVLFVDVRYNIMPSKSFFITTYHFQPIHPTAVKPRMQ